MKLFRLKFLKLLIALNALLALIVPSRLFTPTASALCLEPSVPFSLQSFNYRDQYIRHRDGLGVSSLVQTDLDKKDSTFKIVAGLADTTHVSFESWNYPGYFLRHEGSRLKLHKKTNDTLFSQDATFKRRPGLADSTWSSFEAYNYPGHYIRHTNSELWLQTGTDALFRQDATWKEAPIVSLQSFNYRDQYIRHRDGLGVSSLVQTDLDKKDSTFKIVAGLADTTHVSFESWNYPGYFLRHEGSRLKLHKKTNDTLFSQDATFKRRPGLADSTWSSFEAYNYPGHYIRHTNSELWLQTGTDALFRQAATWKERLGKALWECQDTIGNPV